jgi:hypothetical protein
VDTFAAWLKGLGLERYLGVFTDNGVDLNSLSLLTDGDLEKLGVLLGHRRTLLRAIGDTNSRQVVAPTALLTQENITTREAVAGEAERRQLTVMFCDLVARPYAGIPGGM